MMAQLPIVDMNHAMHNATLTVRITGERRFKMRVWVATKLIAIACYVLGCRLDIETDLQQR